ncbi:uncharacterized protein LOC126681735 [Mercurialis annua]|uniref:uncharacterized protein LOC126681735 n=1 Tax=Mercurialis annua TaxID=3986 RepID=UPI00215FAAA2|nr:uncharacterized protein LOC126681735 [Mercurialis annua]
MTIPFTFISWNCRGGLLNHRKQHFVQSLVNKYHLSFFGLLETKKDTVDAFLVRKLWPNLYFDFAWVPSVGPSSGLLVIWNTIILQNTVIVSGSRWICMDFTFNSLPIRHILVYASNLASERLSLWNELLPLSIYTGLVFISGDFNDVLSPAERFLCTDFLPSMIAFRDFLNVAELVDLPLQGRSFTWQNSFSKSRIDRCCSSLSAVYAWSSSSLTALSRGLSDHVPILFQSNVKIDWGPKPFRSIDSWWEHSEFSSFVKSSWDSLDSTTNPLPLVRKLKQLRERIKTWNTDVYGDQNKKKTELSAEVAQLDIIADSRSLLVGEIERLADIKSQL